MTFDELKTEIDKLERLFVDSTRLRTEYHRKITWSFASLVFILLGFPIAVMTHRREKSANIFLAIFCAACYYLLSLGCEALSIEKFAPVALIMWIPNTVIGIIALFLNYKCVS